MENLYKKLKKEFFIIAGPCVVENEKTTSETANFLKDLSEEFNFNLVFKSSFQKANRTSQDSFKGLGMEKGLFILKKIKQKYGLPILTDIHLPFQVEDVAKVADILQIPAFLARQTSLLQSTQKVNKIVNIKKAQFMATEDLKGAIEKVGAKKQILLTERGTSFGYHNLVVDFRNFIKMKDFGFPVIYDVTHSLQKPSIGKVSGGNPEYSIPMAIAAISTGYVNGLFLETHPNPKKALSDGASMVDFRTMRNLVTRLKKIGKF